MFKNKFTLLNKDWVVITKYKSRVKPNEGEYIYVGENKQYYKVIKVIHSIKPLKQIILVVEEVKNF